ncbi:hypothetical protein UA08_05474 [Talaromyces atroroseus]|uniref:HMG box domain-containing protein n=1 Tax=Talaromyces atroroseus TaxID=1441469 RepID=A0A225AHZ0_TALAT|nr:hypothetical protein UA08_05474 [Talaromyces atroroseus]OKL58913.1 hypothetical protein UA08_05474 [Talaromyces atroroseus]
MQFIFAARRGRRVLQRFNKLQQTATLSTRVPLATSHVQHVFRTAENRAAPLIKTGNYTLERFTTVQKYHYSAAATDKPRKGPKETEGSKKKDTKAKKPKKTKKTKKEVTPEQMEKKKAAQKKVKLRKEIKDLKLQSLRKEEPRSQTLRPWIVFIREKVRGTTSLDESRSRFQTAAEEYRNLSASEREALERQTAATMQERNRIYAEWVNSHTPLQIKTANRARRRLAFLTAEHRKNTLKYPAIKDDRLVKMPTSSYIFFSRERMQSGDLDHLSTQEKRERVHTEWAAASEQEKQPYSQKAAEDKERYVREYREVYGEDPRSSSNAKSKTASSA